MLLFFVIYFFVDFVCNLLVNHKSAYIDLVGQSADWTHGSTPAELFNFDESELLL